MKKIDITTEDIKYAVQEATRQVLKYKGLIKEGENLSSGFKDHSTDKSGWVSVGSLDDGTIRVTIASEMSWGTEYSSREEIAERAVKVGYETLITKLRPFQNIAAKNGFDMHVSDPKTENDNRYCRLIVDIRIIDSNGNATQSIAKTGYEYCATVIPMEQTVKKEDGSYGGMNTIPALVLMAPKFANSDIGPVLRSTSTTEKCAACGRSVGRSQYIIYYNKETNDVIKLGTNCAVNQFGYSPAGANFMKRIQLMFSTIGYHDLVAHDPDGFPIEPHLSLRDMSRHSYFEKIAVPLTYHYLNEPSFNVKAYGYDVLAQEAENMFKKDRNGEIGKIGKWYMEHGDDVPTFEDYKTYWGEKNPVGDWDTACKTVAMAIASEGVRIPAAQVGRFQKILPYTIIELIKKQRQAQAEPGLEGGGAVKKEYAQGDAIKEDVHCKYVGSTYFQKWNSYLVKLQGFDGNTFSYWANREPAFEVGTEVVIKSAIVKKIFNGDIQLTNQQVISVDRQAEIQKRNDEAAALPYPEDGTRLRNEQFKVVKTEMGDGYYTNQVKRATVEDKNGCKYYLFLITDFEGRVSVKPFPYKEGDVITLTGTVEKKNGRNGVYYKLSRVIFDK